MGDNFYPPPPLLRGRGMLITANKPVSIVSCRGLDGIMAMEDAPREEALRPRFIYYDLPPGMIWLKRRGLPVALGVLISLFLSLPSLIAGRWTVSRLRKRVAELEKTAQEHQTRAAALEATLAEQRDELEGFQDDAG